MLVLCNASASSCTGQVFKIAAPPKQSQACLLPPARGTCIPAPAFSYEAAPTAVQPKRQARKSRITLDRSTEMADTRGFGPVAQGCADHRRHSGSATTQVAWGFVTGLGKAGGAGHDDSEEQLNKGSAGRAAPGAGCGLAPFRCVHSIVRFGSKLHRQHGCAGPAGPPTALNATDTFATLATLVSTRSGNARHVELARGH